jgi:hypothetical protein
MAPFLVVLSILLSGQATPIWTGSFATPGPKVTRKIGPLVKGQFYRLLSQGTCVEERTYYGVEPGTTYFEDDPPEATHYTRWVPSRSSFGAGLHIQIDDNETTVLDAGGEPEETRVEFRAQGRFATLVTRDDSLDEKLRCTFAVQVVPLEE